MALLASFVTSIATGIITATLLEQAPPAVTQTINRVVERTIEQVVQVPEKNQTAATVVTKETIVVKEDDQIIKAVEKNEPALVKFISQSSVGGSEPWVIAMGVIVDRSGLIVVYKPLLNQDAAYAVKLYDDNVYPVRLVYDDGVRGLLVYEIISEEPLSLQSVPLGDSDGIKLGQSVILLGGKEGSVVVEGMVSSLSESKSDATATTTAKSISEIFVNFSGKSNYPGLIINLTGQVIGFKAESYEGSKILPSNSINRTFLAYTNSLKEE